MLEQKYKVETEICRYLDSVSDVELHSVELWPGVVVVVLKDRPHNPLQRSTLYHLAEHIYIKTGVPVVITSVSNWFK